MQIHRQKRAKKKKREQESASTSSDSSSTSMATNVGASTSAVGRNQVCQDANLV